MPLVVQLSLNVGEGTRALTVFHSIGMCLSQSLVGALNPTTSLSCVEHIDMRPSRSATDEHSAKLLGSLLEIRVVGGRQ
jgi:hypothetical protein